MICLRKVIHDTINVRFYILRALDIQMPVGTDMQCVGNTEMIPEKLMECGVLVNPYDLVDRDDRISVNGGLDKKVVCDKHIFRCKLGQRCKFFLRLV